MSPSRIQMLTHQTAFGRAVCADGLDSSATRAPQTSTLSFISAIRYRERDQSPSQSFVTLAYSIRPF